MTLRMRLFLLLGALVAVLVAAEWWLVRSLARDLSTEIGQVAFRVGESLVATVALSGHDFTWSSAPGTELLDERKQLDGSLTRTFVLESRRSGGVPAEGADVMRARSALVQPRTDGSSALDGLSPEEMFRLLQALEELREKEAPLHPTPRVVVLDEEGRELEGEARRTAIEEGEAQLVLALDSPLESSALHLRGPSLDERIPIPREGVDDALDSFLERLLAYSGGLLAAGLALAAFVAHRATAPLRELSQAARQIGEGALGTQVSVRAGGEVGEAVFAFNGMSRRLAELDAQARQLSESKHLGELGEVARGLAHGLRNPLHALGLSLEELAAGEADETQRAALADSARRQIRRVDQSIKSFLALAASGANAREEVRVNELVEDVVLEVLQDARGRVHVAAQIENRPPPVTAVPAELRALLQALLVNAVEASPDGEKVVARVRGEGEGLRVEVEDRGPGLPPAVREKLFTPHVTTKSNGAGMGLFLAHRIATSRLGGELRLEEREGGGTRAVLELPAAEADRG